MTSDRRRLRIFIGVLFAVALLGYGGVLFEARSGRARVTDWTPFAEQLATRPSAMANAALYPQFGFADVGVNFRLPLRASWRLRLGSSRADGDAYLFLTADEPLFYSASARVRIALAQTPIGTIRARAAGATTGPFVPDLARELLLVPPQDAYGYQFPLGRARDRCAVTCVVSIAGDYTTWRIYRLGLVTEAARFSTPPGV